MNREIESACMRPLARALTKNLDSLRSILREQCLCNIQEYTEKVINFFLFFLAIIESKMLPSLGSAIFPWLYDYN